jgi:Fe-S cluster biogenesis protein NfuA/hemerythrin superfamily protein
MADPLDVIELLVQDHRLIGRLLEQLDEEQQPYELRLLYQRLVDLLSAHEAAEQQLVFPALRSALPAGEREAANRLAEHAEIDELLAELRAHAPAGAEFAKGVSALIIELQSHFRHEEESTFPRIEAALSPHQMLELAELATPTMASPPADLYGDVAQRVTQVLDHQINPAIALHGGHAELVSVEGEAAYLRLSGGCSGCGMAAATIAQGIEVAIFKSVVDITRVVDVTDHASGTNPYYVPAKK